MIHFQRVWTTPSMWTESVSVCTPFEASKSDSCVVLSEKAVKKKLEEEEEGHKCNGSVVHHTTSADKFLMLGLELECFQWATDYVLAYL